MSHFTHIKTRFQNILYLEKALNRLNINYVTKQENNGVANITIPQSNGYDIGLVWNNEEYEFIVDMSFWEQPYPIESFIDKVSQYYAGEVIIGEGQRTGFQPVTYKQNVDQSTTLVLERWNIQK